MTILVRSSTLRVLERAKPLTMMPTRWPLWGAQPPLMGEALMLPPPTVDVGFEVWPKLSHSKVAAYQVPSIFAITQGFPFTPSTAGHTRDLL